MLPAKRTTPAHNVALDAVLTRLVGADVGTDTVRADTPDGWITAVRRQPPVSAVFAPFPDSVDPRLRDVLAARGIEQLYCHQAEVIAHATAGRHVVVTTPTASGKTLCYNAPVLSAILRDPSSRALYLFPTKALAQDQLAELHEMSSRLSRPDELEIGVFTYDGDTPQDARRAIRGRAHVVLSNPDMIHSGILPHHPRWAKLFENLRYVVIDELHAYRGVFGSHLTNVLRRLRRVCEHYGSKPTFICSSATIANPRELAEALVEAPFELVEKTGAPRGEKVFLFVNPPVVNQELGIRRSCLSETRRIAGEFLKRKLQLIVFAQSRLATEILTTYLKDDFKGPPGGGEEIRGYRGGYLPQRRREIERGLREGSVRAVVSTNALELGMDIGALDVSVMAGYPGTVAATWQRAGRAGRRSGQSAAVLVASSAPLDQYVVRNPSYFFDASPEHALVNPDNLHILVDHVKCAAFELPFQRHRPVWPPRRPGSAGHPAGERLRAPDRRRPGRRPVAVDQRVLSRRRGQPAVDLVGQLRGGGHHARRERHRRDQLHQRPVHAAREGHLSAGRGALSGREAGLRGAQGVRTAHRLRLLHRRDQSHESDDPGHVRAGERARCRGAARVRRSPGPRRRAGDGLGRRGLGAQGTGRGGARAAVRVSRGAAGRPGRRRRECARRGARVVPRRGIQEDQVLHERERGIGRSGSARAADAHHRLLADGAARGGRGASLRSRRSTRRRRWPVVRHAPGGAAAPDVRPPGRRRGDRQRRRRGAAAPALACEGRREAAPHLHLRQLSRRHRVQPAALRDARGAAGPHARDDRRAARASVAARRA